MNAQSSPEATAHVAEFALLFLDLWPTESNLPGAINSIISTNILENRFFFRTIPSNKLGRDGLQEGRERKQTCWH
jgi:hypothetical protein